jgi:hypothetical protein
MFSRAEVNAVNQTKDKNAQKNNISAYEQKVGDVSALKCAFKVSTEYKTPKNSFQ